MRKKGLRMRTARGSEYDGVYDGDDADVNDVADADYEENEGDGEDYGDVVDDGDVYEACYVDFDARVDVEDAGPEEAGDEGADNDDVDDRREDADADGDVHEVDSEDDDADDAEFHNASMIILRMSMPIIGTLLLTVVY